ncbi:MAG: hypothetical protein H7A25_03335 [Leptospiraceae bacterium]|nr:hypothetical protein [Leptospiraceae bacterium]MCP5498909.1 hypothetical protein [Leptospiraceae bacterium]
MKFLKSRRLQQIIAFFLYSLTGGLMANCPDIFLKRYGAEIQSPVFEDRLMNSMKDIQYIFPELKGRLHFKIVDSNEIDAVTDGKTCILLAEKFLETIYSPEVEPHLSRGMLTFAIGHEIGHILKKHRSSCSISGVKKFQGIESEADIFGGFLLFALEESFDSPGKLFSLLNSSKSNHSSSCHGDLEKREALLLKNIAEIKFQARVYRNAIDSIFEGNVSNIKNGIEELKNVKTGLKKIGFERNSIFDYAIASSYHRLWLLDKNEPSKLSVQVSIHYPASLTGIFHRSPSKVPGNLSYYQTAIQYYESYLKKNQDDPYVLMDISLLYMYDPVKTNSFLNQIKTLAKKNISEPAFLNNLGSAYLYASLHLNKPFHRNAEMYLLQSRDLLALKGKQDPKLEAKTLFNLARLYASKQDKEKYLSYQKLYIQHRGSDIAWKYLLGDGKFGNDKVKNPAVVNNSDNFRLGMNQEEILSRISEKKFHVRKMEFIGYILLEVIQAEEIYFKFWLQKGRLIKMSFYPASKEKVEGISCGDKIDSIPESLGIPIIQGNRWIFPGTNLTFKTIFEQNEERIALIEMRSYR